MTRRPQMRGVAGRSGTPRTANPSQQSGCGRIGSPAGEKRRLGEKVPVFNGMQAFAFLPTEKGGDPRTRYRIRELAFL
jgi:hypothetical protein